MNTIASRWSHGSLALVLIALAGAGCAHKTQIPKSVPANPVTSPAVAAPSSASSSEKRLQLRIETLQEEVRGLSVKVDASERTYWGMMSADWQQKVRAAKADATSPAERIRYLEALEAVLARKLRSLQAEAKTYEAYQMADPLVPRK